MHTRSIPISSAFSDLLASNSRKPMPPLNRSLSRSQNKFPTSQSRTVSTGITQELLPQNPSSSLNRATQNDSNASTDVNKPGSEKVSSSLDLLHHLVFPERRTSTAYAYSTRYEDCGLTLRLFPNESAASQSADNLKQVEYVERQHDHPAIASYISSAQNRFVS